MALQNISISAIKFDNEPFVRSLTASLLTNNVIATGSNLIRWNFPINTVWAVNTKGISYTRSTAQPVSSFGTIIFYLSTTKYDITTKTYDLCAINIQCQSLSSNNLRVAATTNYTLTVDTFPDFDYTLYVNNENTNDNTLFYRLTSNSTWPAKISFTSDQFNFTNTLSSTYHSLYYTLNNITTRYYSPTSTFNFVRTPVGLTKRLSSVNAFLSAYNSSESLSAWYTPHTITKSITAGFVPYFLSAGNFIAFPLSYFETFTKQLLSSSYSDYFTTSPGLCFYGEGHTERINLSAQPTTGAQTYTWRVNDGGQALYSAFPNQNLGYILLSTVPGEDRELPLSLQVSDNLLNTNEPRYYIDDSDGLKKYYPYYKSTVTPYGVEEVLSPFFQNIEVKPYLTTYIGELVTGIPNNASTVLLPIDKRPASFVASYNIILSRIQPCQDKYDFIWKWSAIKNYSLLFGTYQMGTNVSTSEFIELTARSGDNFSNFNFAQKYLQPNKKVRLTFLTQTPLNGSQTAPPSGEYTIYSSSPESFYFEVSTNIQRAISGDVIMAIDIGEPTLFVSASSWSTTQCSVSTLGTNLIFNTNYFPGIYPKRWRNEGAEDPTRFFPGIYEYSNIFWDLSASTPLKKWEDPQVVSPSAVKTYTYSLKLSEFGGNSSQMGSFATSYFSDTLVALGAKQTVTCLMTSGIYDPITFAYLTAGDWLPRSVDVMTRQEFTSFEPPLILLYTPNRFIEVNTPTRIQNASLRLTRSVTAVNVLLDDIAGESVYLTGGNIEQDFNISYSTIGFKTISVQGYPRFYIGTFTVTYPNLLQVVQTYDQIFPETYYTRASILDDLPWKEKPTVGSNDWVIADNINSCIKQFDDNLTHLNNRSQVYLDEPNDYFGWLGPQPTVIEGITACPLWTWEDLDCSDTDSPYNLNWTAVMSGGVVTDITKTGEFATCGLWQQHECPSDLLTPKCLQKYCVEWNWQSRRLEVTDTPITWKEARLSGAYPKRWYFESCENIENINCDSGVWNVNIPNLDRFYDPIPDCYSQDRCKYVSITSRDNILFTALRTQIKLLSSDYRATYFDQQYFSDASTPFAGIVAIALDSEKKIFILDNILSKITCYIYEESKPGEKWTLFTNWGGYGGSNSTTRFNNPVDFHIDQYDTLWVVDAGNFVIKHFTNTGSWIKTIRDSAFLNKKITSVCVDSANNVHVANSDDIRVYSYEGEYLFSYTPAPDKFIGNIVKIRSSYNREIIYIASKTCVIRHFRNGEYSGTILNNKQCVDNISDLYHDEYRNLLIANDNKILKYSDLMTLIPLKGNLPATYWTLKDMYIHEEEYVQNWVYTRSLQRLWDNIETFRNTLFYRNNNCQVYTPPIYSKDKITVGQNEIVTSTVINRALGYLWANYQTLLKYFDPNCKLT
jgi:hypothetical protein